MKLLLLLQTGVNDSTKLFLMSEFSINYYVETKKGIAFWAKSELISE